MDVVPTTVIIGPSVCLSVRPPVYLRPLPDGHDRTGLFVNKAGAITVKTGLFKQSSASTINYYIVSLVSWYVEGIGSHLIQLTENSVHHVSILMNYCIVFGFIIL